MHLFVAMNLYKNDFCYIGAGETKLLIEAVETYLLNTMYFNKRIP